MKHISLKTKCSLCIGICLGVFAVFSIVISYIFYSDALNSNINRDIQSSKTQFFIIFSCAEILVAIIVILLVMYMSDAFIVKPLVQIYKAINSLNMNSGLDNKNPATDSFNQLNNLEIKSSDEIEDIYKVVQRMYREATEKLREARSGNWEAEHDAMTMLSNSIALDKRVSNIYPYSDTLYAACVNIVNIRMLNEQIGTNAGDSVISKVARELRRLQSDSIHCYRLENDNFLIIMLGYQKDEASSILKRWNERIGRLNRSTDLFECRLAIGESFGFSGFNVRDIISAADADMYCQKAIIKGNMVNFNG